ncbi:MAG: methyltransferase [Bacteroidia bacterium]|nr:methyltransferase [Bacteroidia bacterium]
MNNVPPNNIVQSNEIIELLKNPEAIAFLEKHRDESPEHLALKYSGSTDFNLTKLTQILQLYRKAEQKIPEWVASHCALDAKSYAQCTHSAVAQFNASLFQGTNALDMTSGLGVDAYFFAKRFEHITCLESNKTTIDYAQFNAQRLGVSNIDFLHTTAEEFSLEHAYDLIYLDPDRRPGTDHQVKQIESYSPNIFELQESLLSCAKHVLVKLSPMVDLRYLENHLHHLVAIYVVSYRNEVKEILVHQSKHAAEANSTERIAVDLGPNQTEILRRSQMQPAKPRRYLSQSRYLIEPSRAIIKSGMSPLFAQSLSLGFLSDNCHYYFNEVLLEHAFVRQFEVIDKMDVSWKKIKKRLKEQDISAINIAQRNFHLDVRGIRNKLKIAEGGTDFLFFSLDRDGKSACYHAIPVSAKAP